MEYLARGFSLSEAGLLATDTPRTARAIVVGDPLYRPFAPHPPRAVPIPALAASSRRTADGWTVTLDADIPVRAALRYTADGAESGATGTAVASAQRFYSRRHTFTLPDAPGVRFVVDATDATGRVTSGEALSVEDAEVTSGIARQRGSGNGRFTARG
jgi:hypothetical protein